MFSSTFLGFLFSDKVTVPSLSTECEGYQHVVVSGTPFERGHMHGIQAKEKVHINIDRNKSSSALSPRHICFQYIEEIYLPAIKSLFPEGLEEMQGIAEGASASLPDIILLNARYDLSRVKHDPNTSQEFVGECTSMAYVEERSSGGLNNVYVAQNWDMSPWLHDLDTIIILELRNPAVDNISEPSVVIALTEAGQLARSGMNSCGLALCANSLWSSEDSSPHKDSANKSFLPFTLARRMFLECGNLAAGIKTLCSFPRHVSGNVIIGSSSGIAMDLEPSPSKYFALHPTNFSPLSTSNLLTHANHFLTPALPARKDISDTYPGGSSVFRDTRLSHLLKEADMKRRRISTAANPDGIAIDDVEMAFGDHAGFPRSLCEHAEKGEQKYGAASSNTMTVASVIYDLGRLEMHVCKGNPCSGAWKKYSLKHKEAGCS